MKFIAQSLTTRKAHSKITKHYGNELKTLKFIKLITKSSKHLIQLMLQSLNSIKPFKIQKTS